MAVDIMVVATAIQIINIVGAVTTAVDITVAVPYIGVVYTGGIEAGTGAVTEAVGVM
jgi:hypothetical protein